MARMEFTAARVKQMRKKTGLSQVQFATKYGISKKTIQKWEQGYKIGSFSQAFLRLLWGSLK